MTALSNILFATVFSVVVVDAANAAEGAAKRRVRDTAGREGKVQEARGGFLPDWPVTGFDWYVSPIAAFKYQATSTDGADPTKTTTFEGGLGAGVQGIPVVPGNPGFTVAPDAGLAYGYNYSVVDSEGGDEKSSTHYRRQWLGLASTLYVKFFRYRLDVRNARLTVSEDSSKLVKSQFLGNDFGVLVLPWLSQHYTLDYLRAYGESYQDKFLEDYDHWFHTRMFFDFWSVMTDFGPGVTHTSEFDPESGGRLAHGRTDYLLFKGHMNPVWKVVLDTQAKYVFNATEKNLGNYAAMRLPEDDLNEPDTLAMPEDSFMGSLFLGVKDIAYGIGAGWRTNIQVLNVQRRGDAPKQTTKTQGLGLYAEVRF